MDLTLDERPVLLQTFFGLFPAIHEHFLLNVFDLVLLVFFLLIQPHYAGFLIEIYWIFLVHPVHVRDFIFGNRIG